MPTHTVQCTGSAIFINAKNPDTRSYAWILDYKYSHDSFGQKKVEYLNAGGSIGPGEDKIIHSLQGTYVSLKLETSISLQWI